MPSFTEKVRQVFHVDMDVSRIVSIEGAVLRLLFLGREIAQVSYAMPPQAAVQPGTRGVRVQKLPHHGQQIVERDQQRLAPCYPWRNVSTTLRQWLLDFKLGFPPFALMDLSRQQSGCEAVWVACGRSARAC